MALLGVLACPEGHSNDISRFWADGQTALFTKGGKKVSLRERFTDGFDIAEMGFEGCSCGHEACKERPEFFVPSAVLNTLVSAGEE